MRAGTGKVVFVMPRCRHDHVRAVHKQALTLSRIGYDITLLVKNDDVSNYMGMDVRVAIAPFKSTLRPILNLPAMFRQATKVRGDVYVLRNPDTIPLALLLKLTGRRVIYDTHEDFSKRPLIHGALPRWLRPATAMLITLLEKLLARVTDGVIVTQRQQVNLLGGHTMLLPNAPLTEGPIIDAARAVNTARADELFSFIYVGEITESRGIFAMLDLIQSLNKEFNCRLDLIGWIRSVELYAEVQQHSGWRYVRFHGAMSQSETLAHIGKSDVGLAILEDIADHSTSSITKLYEYMQCGIPFIASDFAAWRAASELGPAGLYVDPEDTSAHLQAARELTSNAALLRRLGNAGILYVETEFNWANVSEPFVSLVEEIVHSASTVESQPG